MTAQPGRSDAAGPGEPAEAEVGDWYDWAEAYDIAFAEDTQAEADFLLAAAEAYGGGAAASCLEPGCGSGRLVAELARRGLTVAGFDRSAAMLEYAARQLAAEGLTAQLFNADLADFAFAGGCDFAFCLCNTFRHLLDEQDIRRHLELVAGCVRPGGLYVVGLHLLPIDADLADGEHWEAERGETKVGLTLKVVHTDLERKREVLRVTIDRTDGAGPRRRRRDWMPLRVHEAGDVRAMLSAAPAWELAALHDFGYDLEEEAELDDYAADVVLVLRRAGKPARRRKR